MSFSSMRGAELEMQSLLRKWIAAHFPAIFAFEPIMLQNNVEDGQRGNNVM